MKKVLLFTLCVMSSLVAEGKLFELTFGDLVFKQDGRFTILYQGENVIARKVTPQGMPQDGAGLVKAFGDVLRNKVNPTALEEIRTWKPVVEDVVVLSGQASDGEIVPSSAGNNDLDGSNKPGEGNDKKGFMTKENFDSILNGIKDHCVDLAHYVVTNAKEYPMQTVAAVLVGGFAGLKVGGKIAQLAKFKKTGTRVTQVVSTISGVTLATLGTWAVLNKIYKA